MFQRFLAEHRLSEYTFCPDFLPTVEDRAFWEAFPNESCVKEAEAALDFDWPVIKATDFMAFKANGNRKVMENPHFARRAHLILFALAELKENKGRFLPQVVNGLLAICEETFWGLSAHWPFQAALGNFQSPTEPYIDLFAAETAEHVAAITTLLRKPLDAFCPEILDRAEYELERRIKAPYLFHRDWWWMGYGTKRPNNWNPWILSNLTTVFLLTERNERRLHRALTKILTESQVYYDGMPEVGGCDEGCSYWGHAGASLFELLFQLKEATGGALDLFDDAKLGRIAAYMKRVHVVSDRFINVGDSHATGKAGMMPLLYGFARETKQSELMNFSVSVWRAGNAKDDVVSPKQNNLRRIIFLGRLMAEMERATVTEPIHGALELLPDLQLATLREGAWCCSVKGGHNRESHNHNDVGSLALYHGVTPVLVDVGINTYTRFTFTTETRYTMIPWTQSAYHNLPLCNGEGQAFGREYQADGFEAREGSVAVSFAGAYAPEAGITRLTREVALTEGGMTCTDRFVFANAEKTKVTETLMTTLPVCVEGKEALLGDTYRLYADRGEARAEFIPFEDETLERDWGVAGVTRILIETEGDEEITLTVEKR